ncbi:MAG: hypothetical protein ACFFD4_14030 [Candidatus Odinarchaeota archaeon]
MIGNTAKRPFLATLIGGFLIFLLFLEIILVTLMFPDMPPQFWLIGIGSAVIGVGILYFSPGKPDQGRVITPETTKGTQLVTDEELQKNYGRAKLMFFGGWAVAAITAIPAFSETIRYGNLTPSALFFAIGTALGLIGLWSMYKYKTDPEGYRAFLAKRWKRS